LSIDHEQAEPVLHIIHAGEWNLLTTWPMHA